MVLEELKVGFELFSTEVADERFRAAGSHSGQFDIVGVA
jgi:hypothetical protein